MKRYAQPRKTLAFVFIASLLMIVTDFAFWPMTEAPVERHADLNEKIYEHSEITDYESGATVKIQPVEKESDTWEIAGLPLDIPQPEPIKNNAAMLSKAIKEPASLKIQKNIIPPAARPVIKGKGLVVIIIDDMGMDRKRSRQALELPGPLTLSFLPYAPQLASITKEAREHGHELLIHVPMQPVDHTLDPGPLALRDDMSWDDFDAELEHMFGSFEGYVGINNHMGSKLTQNREAMDRVMEALVKRGLLFVDSKTIATSVAAQSAAEHGLAFAERDIFLDNKNDRDVVMNALDDLERVAKRRGYAVAIGHPRDATIAVLKEWLPEMKKRGLTLVPVSRVTHKAPLVPATATVSYSQKVPGEAFGPVQSPSPQP